MPNEWNEEEAELLDRLDRGETVVVNLRRHRTLARRLKADGRLVRVCRPSPWGNPYRMTSEADRADVIRRYRDEHWPRLPEAFRAKVGDLYGKALACWCAPAPCHADVLVEHAREARGDRVLRTAAHPQDPLAPLPHTAAPPDRSRNA